MFGIGAPEIAVILLLSLLLFGPQKLPEIARTLGRAAREARKAWTEFQRQLWEAESEIDKELKG
ncbi:MAG: twin-arginine translocase TatA/TatE family subunit [Armatimonadetes bacterium]|nr:twin-arginine translocase TatA/TatE family subunit [Armatimonadota bacterium]MDW8121727.1 twin-arginine translocase TatA/TatE family subunit [Armatimonadota bacterium]